MPATPQGPDAKRCFAVVIFFFKVSTPRSGFVGSRVLDRSFAEWCLPSTKLRIHHLGPDDVKASSSWRVVVFFFSFQSTGEELHTSLD